ncbi:MULTISPECIES: hypothetical protein [unclassified Cupriavidus]|uniref:hypothetical protein n=1 Tax=unclassified Cupriavidus TaxID=2640874 RepID=UPI00313E1B7E
MISSDDNSFINDRATQFIESLLNAKRGWTESGHALSMIWIKAMQGMTCATRPVDAMLAHAKSEASLNAMALAGGFTEREVQLLSFRANAALLEALRRFGDLSAEGTRTMVSVEVDAASTSRYLAAAGVEAVAMLH